MASVASSIARPKRRSGLSRAVPRDRLRVPHARERPQRRLSADRLEARDDAALEHVEHVLALDERHLEVELAELELPVRAQILVAPACCDLVVAVEPADHAQLLEELRRLRQRVELAGLEPDGHEEVARTLRCSLRHARRPDVDEGEVVHRPPDRVDDDVVEAQVALHAVAAHVEVAVPKAEHLVHALVADLEGQRLRRRDDAQRVDLDLDLARRDVRIDRVRRARDDLALGLEDELVAHVVRLRVVLGPHDQLDDAGVVAQVDEHETAVIAARVDPAGERHPTACIARAQHAAHRVAPAHVSSSISWATLSTATSSSPARRSIQPSAPTMTVARACFCPYVTWPLSERPAWSESAAIPAARSS